MNALTSNKTNRQVEKYYKNTFLRQFADRKTNAGDRIYVCQEVRDKCYLKKQPRKHITKWLKHCFQSLPKKIFPNDVDQMVSTEIRYLGDPDKLTPDEIEQKYKDRLESLQKKVDKLRREGAQDLFLDELLQME